MSNGSQDRHIRSFSRFLLLFYPRDFRRAVGGDLQDAQVDWFRAQRAGREKRSVVYLALRMLVGAIRDGLAERMHTGRRAGRSERISALGACDRVLADFRSAMRSMRRVPGFWLLTSGTLALGIGASTAMFSVVDGVLLRPLPYEKSHELVQVAGSIPEFNGLLQVSLPNFRDWVERSRSFSGLATIRRVDADVSGGESPRRYAGAGVASSFFSILGARPTAGRLLTNADDGANAARVAVVSFRLWETRWGRDAGLVGRTITLNDQPFEVVGVLEQGFIPPEALGLREVDFWIPGVLSVIDRDYEDRGRGFFEVIGRLASDVTLNGARLEMAGIAEQLAAAHPEANRFRGTPLRSTVEPLRERTVGAVAPAIATLLGAVGFLFLIACTNAANIILVRASDRRHEMAIRTSLGASRGDITRQLISEGILASSLAGTGGLALAYLGVETLKALAPGNVPRIAEVALDGRILAFAILLSGLTGIALGVVPALTFETKSRPGYSLHGAHRHSNPSQRRVRHVLVILQTALAFVLLVGAGLLINSFLQLQRVDPGFNPNDVVVVEAFYGPRYFRSGSDRSMRTTRQALVEGLAAVPGVRSVGTTLALPLGGSGSKGEIPISIADRPDEAFHATFFSWVSPDYFGTLGIRMLSGSREFASHDVTAGQPVVIVSAALARDAWPGESAIDKRIKVGPTDRPGDWARVIGVADDVAGPTLTTRQGPGIYFPDAGGIWGPPLYLLLKTNRDAVSLAGEIRQAVAGVDSDIPVGRLSSYSELISSTVTEPRFYTFVFAILAGVALLLSTVGLYGTVSYSVMQRRREVGLRMALGADARKVVTLVVREGMQLGVVGLALGLGGAFTLSHFLTTFLFGVTATDAKTFALVSALLAITTFAACMAPARRAARTDPMTTLTID